MESQARLKIQASKNSIKGRKSEADRRRKLIFFPKDDGGVKRHSQLEEHTYCIKRNNNTGVGKKGGIISTAFSSYRETGES